uniref:Uncharacterized protein n=1 Tax=Hyaloperonospora arabidopsidis (strain Emoy2) TaxID=559515 RepID=M4BKC6_HYAAE
MDGKVTNVLMGAHNHPSSFDIAADPNSRQLTPEHMEYAMTLIRTDQKPSEISEVMKLRFGVMCRLIEKDIANLEQKENKHLLVGQDEMTALVT